MTIAVFDVDGTLVPGSTERLFFRWLFRNGYLGPRQLSSFLWFGARWATVYGRHTFCKNKAYLAGIEERAVTEEAQAFVDADIRRRFFRSCRDRVESHLAAGDYVMLLTGTLQPIADAIARHLGVDHVIATRCAIRDGRYTSAPPPSHPFGDDKRVLFESEREHRIRADGPVFAYTNSVHELSLLAAVDRPVCVMPDRQLRELALRRGWEILDAAPAPE